MGKRVVQFTYDGEEYEVTPDFSFIERIESRFTLLEFLKGAGSNPKVSYIAWVIYCALTGSGQKVKYNDIGDWCAENLVDANLAATEIASAAFSGGPEKPSKKK